MAAVSDFARSNVAPTSFRDGEAIVSSATETVVRARVGSVITAAMQALSSIAGRVVSLVTPPTFSHSEEN
jgi:hypothetical protein